MELDENDLENVLGGAPLSYEEAKARSKFKDIDKKKEVKEELHPELGELSEKDLENYLGGIRIEGEEYFQKR